MLARQLLSNDLVTWAPVAENALESKSEREAGKRWYELGTSRQFTCSGTSAIYHVARALRLRSSDEVLLPAYRCGKEAAAFVHLGIRPVYYRIDDDLSPRIEHVERLITPKTSAMLVTHFFGFPASLHAVKAICREHRIRLIEDCAHALFGRAAEGPLGTTGDAAVFSPRKFLPIPDGGIAVLNSAEFAFPDEARPPSTWLTAGRIINIRHKSLKRNAPLAVRLPRRLAFSVLLPFAATASAFTKAAAALSRQWHSEVRPFNPPGRALLQGMSPTAWTYLERCTEWETVVDRRRCNYARLLTAARQVTAFEPLFGSLPPGVNPLCFPVRIAAPAKAAAAVRRRGVVAAAWWPLVDPAMDCDAFPSERRLRSSILVFPVHQSLSPGALDRIVDSFGELRR
jgi:hypothetical protein